MQNNMRDKLIDLLEQVEGQVNNDVPPLEMIADHLIANDVVAVVRCKDCEYCCESDIEGYGICISMTNPNHVKLDHYCFYGERKDNSGDL